LSLVVWHTEHSRDAPTALYKFTFDINIDSKLFKYLCKNCRFNTIVTMTQIKLENGKNSFSVFSHAKF